MTRKEANGHGSKARPVTRRAKRRKCHSSNILFLKEMRRRPKDGTMMAGGEVEQLRASTVHQVKVEVHAALQYAASSHCLVEEWKDFAELEPKPKEMSFSVHPKGDQGASRGVVCTHKQMLLHGVWKELQEDEGAREL